MFAQKSELQGLGTGTRTAVEGGAERERVRSEQAVWPRGVHLLTCTSRPKTVEHFQNHAACSPEMLASPRDTRPQRDDRAARS